MTPTGFHYQPHRIHSRRAISLRCAGRPAGHRPHRCNSRLTLTTATANDSDGTVRQVDFYQGTTLIGTAAAPPYSVIWSNVANGSYSLTAVATDNQGVVTTSAAVPIIVSAAIAIYNIYPDQLGTPRLVTNASNQVVWRNLPTTEPFGNTPPEDDPNATGNHFKFNLRFPGQYADKETNTNYNGFRDYDPSTGRYLQSDPIGLAGGSWSTYTYVRANPISGVDPLGLWVVYLGGTGTIFGGPLGASAGGGFVFDSSGNWGTYKVIGVGGGVGGDASFGLSIGAMGATSSAPVTTISDFGGPFANASVGAGLGPHVSVEGFYDPYTPTNRGGGVTIGPGVGGGVSVQATNTIVTPNTLSWRDLIPDWMKPSSNRSCH